MNSEAVTSESSSAPQPVGGIERLRALTILLRFAAPYRRRMFFFSLAMIVSAGCFLVIGQGLKQVVDRGFSGGDPAALNQGLFFLLTVIVVMASATWVRFYLISWLGERVIADLRRKVFSHLLTLSPAWFEQTRTGEMISRLTTDTALLEQIVGTSVSMALRNGLLGAGALVMLMLTSWKLTLLVLLTVPVVIVPIVLFGRRVRKLARASQDRVADLGSYVDEALHEIRTVQAYGHEATDRKLFGRRIEAAFDTARQRIQVRASLISAVIVLVFAGIGIILWIGGHDVLAGKLTAGELSAFVFYAAMVASAAAALSEVMGDLQRGAGAAERLIEILNTNPTIVLPENLLAFPKPAVGSVELDAVTFHYPSRPAIAALEDFTLAIAPGEKLALVGPSGAGKSTVFQLLLRFYDPQRGTIRIDGVDIRRVDPCSCAIASRWCRRSRSFSRPASPRTYATAGPKHPMPMSDWPARRRSPRNSSSACLRDSALTWASAACACRVASVSDWRSRARSCRTARSCCWMKPRPRSTPSLNAWCRSHSRG